MKRLLASILVVLSAAQPASAQFRGPDGKAKPSELNQLTIQTNQYQPFTLLDLNGQPAKIGQWNQSHANMFFDFRTPGTSTPFSAEEWGLDVQATAEANTNAPAAYEKAAIFGRIQNNDLSTFASDKATVGVIGQGIVGSANTLGEVWGLIGGAGIAPGGSGDGSLVGIEADLFNNGSNQSTLFTDTSKYGLIVDNQGPNNMSVGFLLEAAAGTMYTGIYTDPVFYVAATDDVFDLNGVTTLQANGNYASTGSMGIGTLTPPTYGLLIDENNASALPLQVENSWGGVSSTNITADFDAYGDASRYSLRRADGSLSSPTGIQSGDVLGSMNYRGWTSGGAFTTGAAAAISAQATENFSGTNNGTELELYTTATGGNTAFLAETLLSGAQFGAPTGGDEGTGTVNAAGSYYKNGVPIAGYGCQGTSASIAAAATDFIACGQLYNTSVIGTEVDAQSIASCTGVLSNLYAQLTTTGNTHPAVITVDDATVGTTLTCTIASSGSTCNDTTHHPAITAGDLLSIKIVNPSSANTTGLVYVGYRVNCGG